MIVTAWRICKRRHARSAFTGEGARRFGGRWNSPGTAMVYTSESQSLAALEMLVHLDSPDLLSAYVLIPVEFDESRVTRVERLDLPRNWRSELPPSSVKAIGDEWISSGVSAVLQVPSVLLPAESNFLLNPRHEKFAEVKIGKAQSFQFDSRFIK